MDLFAALADERRKLADVLGSLDDTQWNTASCCTGWTVEDVAAHLTVVWNYSALDYVRIATRNRSVWFRPRAALNAVNVATVNERKAIGRTALIDDLRAHAEDRTTPPTVGAEAPLTDILMHGRDICLPLGIELDTDPARAVPALRTAISRRFNLFNNRSKLKGLMFAATDTDWTHGTGPRVDGPALALAHAMWGRPAALDELTGDGVDVLRTRVAR